MKLFDKDSGDMWEFVSALYLHGPNPETLCTVLPSWSKADVEFLIRKFKLKADKHRQFLQGSRKERQALLQVPKERSAIGTLQAPSVPIKPGSKYHKRPPLLTWSELVQKVHGLESTSDKTCFGAKVPANLPIRDHSQLISKVMLYTACFEDHYHGSGDDDTGYSEIYRYLSQLLAGEEPTQLRPKSAAKIVELTDRLTAMLETGALNERMQTLLNSDFSNIEIFPVGVRCFELILLRS